MLRLALFCRIAGPCLTGEFADRYGSMKPGPMRFDPDDPEFAGKLVQAGPDDLTHDLVRDQLAGIDVAPDVGAELRMALDVPAEDVADADVDEVVGLGEQLRLRALATALNAHDHELAHRVSVSRIACALGTGWYGVGTVQTIETSIAANRPETVFAPESLGPVEASLVTNSASR